MISEKFIIVAALVHLSGQLSYIVHTVQGKTKPNRVSWFMWAFAALVAFSAQLHEGVGLQALMTFMVGFGPLMIFFASFVNKKSYWRITRFDLICGALALLGLLLWLTTREGSTAIAFAIAGDTFAGIPTFRKAFRHPETESWYLYFIATLFSGITLLTIDHWNFATYGFPLYVFIACVFLLASVRFKVGTKMLGQRL